MEIWCPLHHPFLFEAMKFWRINKQKSVLNHIYTNNVVVLFVGGIQNFTKWGFIYSINWYPAFKTNDRVLMQIQKGTVSK